jgi:hypothetical protein
MTNSLRFLVFGLVLSMGMSCGVKDDGTLSSTDALHARQLGQPAAGALMSQLKNTLVGTLKTEGPVAAMKVCNLEAGTILQAVSLDFPECTISRTTRLTRNPHHGATAADETVMQLFEALPQDQRASADHVLKHGKTLVYYRPLWIEAPCMTCHGDPATFAPDLQAELTALYPEDRAVGYAEGDLRGVLKVEMSQP